MNSRIINPKLYFPNNEEQELLFQLVAFRDQMLWAGLPADRAVALNNMMHIVAPYRDGENPKGICPPGSNMIERSISVSEAGLYRAIYDSDPNVSALAAFGLAGGMPWKKASENPESWPAEVQSRVYDYLCQLTLPEPTKTGKYTGKYLVRHNITRIPDSDPENCIITISTHIYDRLAFKVAGKEIVFPKPEWWHPEMQFEMDAEAIIYSPSAADFIWQSSAQVSSDGIISTVPSVTGQVQHPERLCLNIDISFTVNDEPYRSRLFRTLLGEEMKVTRMGAKPGLHNG